MRLSQKSLLYKVLTNIRENNLVLSGEKIIVAVSGGADSVCLLDVLFKLKDELGVTILVCHYNHRLRGEDSYNDFEFVKKLALDRGVEFIGGEAKKENLFGSEDEARVARYDFFKKILEEGRGDKVAIAHNLNDLAETFLFRLFRGSGLRGLKSIPYSRENFIRPLLTIPRSDIEAYLKDQHLSYRIDLTNKNIAFSRNFIRLKLLPLVNKLNPNFLETLYYNIVSIEEDYALLDKLTDEAFNKALIAREPEKIILDRKKWLALHSSIQTNVLRFAIADISTLENITNKHIYEVKKVLQKGNGKKYKPLPHSLRIELQSGKIIIMVGKTE